MASQPPIDDTTTDNLPADTEFEPAAPLTDAGVQFEAETDETPSKGAAMFGGAAQTLKSEAGKLTQQATDKARAYALDGKDRAGGAIDEFAKMMTDAAGTVDEKLGEQYGQYARSAADQLSSLAETIRTKEVDELIADARDFVRKSPAIAIGTAAAVGFVLARLVKSGLENNTNDNTRA